MRPLRPHAAPFHSCRYRGLLKRLAVCVTAVLALAHQGCRDGLSPAQPACEAPKWATPYAATAFNRINEARRQAGLECLRMEAHLAAAARNHAAYLSMNSLLTHTEDSSKPGYTGYSFGDRTAAAGHTGALGEVIANGYSSADLAVQAWLRSPRHKEVLLNQAASEIGVSAQGDYACAVTGKVRPPGP